MGQLTVQHLKLICCRTIAVSSPGAAVLTGIAHNLDIITIAGGVYNISYGRKRAV